MILLITILFIFSLFSLVSSVNATYGEDYYNQTHKEYYNYHYFNGTIVDKDDCYQYYNYLVDVDGTTFYLYGGDGEGHKGLVGNFNVGDRVTIYGNAINKEGNMHRMRSSEFNGKYWNINFNLTKNFPEIHLGGEKVRLANGFVRGQSSSVHILKATITNGNPKYDQTKCKVYVGKQHAGERVYIGVLYACKDEYLNNGNIVPKKVSSTGEISVKTAKPLKKYPEKALIAICDSNENILEAEIVNLSKKSKPQSFHF